MLTIGNVHLLMNVNLEKCCFEVWDSPDLSDVLNTPIVAIANSLTEIHI